MAARKSTAKKKNAPATHVWTRFSRSKPGRIIIMACAFAAVIAIFAWIAGSDISLFLLLTGILMLLANILIWVIYLAVRERQPKTAAKKRTARKQTVR